MTSRFVSWLHAAIGTGFEFPRPRRGDTMPSKNRGFAHRLGVEQLEARQMLTATLLHTLNNPTPLETDNFGTSVAISGNTIVVGEPGGGPRRARPGERVYIRCYEWCLAAHTEQPDFGGWRRIWHLGRNLGEHGCRGSVFWYRGRQSVCV